MIPPIRYPVDASALNMDAAPPSGEVSTTLVSTQQGMVSVDINKDSGVINVNMDAKNLLTVTGQQVAYLPDGQQMVNWHGNTPIQVNGIKIDLTSNHGLITHGSISADQQQPASAQNLNSPSGATELNFNLSPDVRISKYQWDRYAHAIHKRSWHKAHHELDEKRQESTKQTAQYQQKQIEKRRQEVKKTEQEEVQVLAAQPGAAKD